MKRYLWALPLAVACVLFCGVAWAGDAVPVAKDFALDLSRHWVVTMMAGVIPMLRTALSSDTVQLPVWAAKWRVVMIVTLSVAATTIEQIMNGIDVANIVTALVVTGGPSIAQEIIKAVFGADPPSGGAVTPTGDAPAPKMSIRPPPGYSSKLIGAVAALAVCAASLPGCAIFKGAGPVVKDVSNTVIEDAQEGKTIVDALHSTANIFFLLHSDPPTQAKVEQVFVDVNLALDAAIRAGTGANAANDGDYNLAFAQFRAAYAKLMQVLQDAGIVSPDASSGKFAVVRGGDAGRVDMPVPRASLERGKK